MRFSSIVLSIGILAANVLAGPTGAEAEMENTDKRGCNTGNWCCVQSNPSTYCINYCRAGSQSINCSASYVSVFDMMMPVPGANGVDGSVRPMGSACANATIDGKINITTCSLWIWCQGWIASDGGIGS